MGATREIAEFVCRTGYKDFDSGLVKHTKDLCLSGIGSMLAGSKMHAGRAVIDYVREAKGPSEAGVVGAGFRTSIEYAAMANGTTGHAPELEDVSFPEGVFTVAIFPTAFAVAEKLHLSGKEVIEAFIIGFEVDSQLGLKNIAANVRGFVPCTVFGCVGATAAAAKLLHLTVDETAAAVSLVASQCSGLVRQVGTGAHLYEAGICGRNGISAALLAKKGLAGRPDIIEMPTGLCDAVAGTAKLELSLGDFRIKGANIRKHPCCGVQMHIIDDVLEMISQYKISPADVESIQVDVHPAFRRLVRFDHPTDEDTARLSIAHSIAACFYDDKVFLDSYTEEKAKDPKFHAIREKVKVVVHPEWEGPGIGGKANPVAIRLKNGTEYKKVCASIETPIIPSDKEIMDKYTNCAERVLSPAKAKQVASQVLSLDKVKDVAELMDILTFPKKK